MKRRQFIALGAAAAVAPALPALPIAEDLTVASFERAVAALGLKAERGFIFTMIANSAPLTIRWSAAEDRTTWSVEPAAPAER